MNWPNISIFPTFVWPAILTLKFKKPKERIPGKAYLYHAVGKPMILGENLANHELFSEQEKGIYFVEMGSGEKLAEKIKKIANIGR